MKEYNIKIKFSDGEIVVLENVTKYSLSEDLSVYLIEFNTGYKAFVNVNLVKYIAREFDLDKRSE